MFLAFSFNVGIIIVKRYERVAETERHINYLLLLLYGGIGASFSACVMASGIARLARLEFLSSKSTLFARSCLSAYSALGPAPGRWVCCFQDAARN